MGSTITNTASLQISGKRNESHYQNGTVVSVAAVFHWNQSLILWHRIIADVYHSEDACREIEQNIYMTRRAKYMYDL